MTNRIHNVRFLALGIIALVLGVSGPAGAQNHGFYYADFSSIDGLNLVGSAAQFGNRLRVTPAATNRAGAAWHIAEQFVEDGFETTFQFEITEWSGGGADGFAFVVQNSSVSALGMAGGNLGYGGIPNSVAVEFDTYHNGVNVDPNSNHISVHTRGTNPNSSHHAYTLGSTTAIPNVRDGNVHTVRIDYIPGTLSVFLDDLANPALTVSLDLAATLSFDNGRAWVGFTAATGAWTENHDILNWSFTGASMLPGIGWVSTYTGGAGGTVTVRIWGIGLADDARVLLRRDDDTTIEADVTAEPGDYLAAVFDLSSATPAEYQLLVINPDGQEFTASQAFIVEPEKRVELWVDILGRDTIRVGRPQTYYIMYGNNGNADAVGVPLWIAGVPKGAAWKLGFELTPPPLHGQGLVPIDFDEVPKHIEREDDIAIPLLVPSVPPGVTKTLQITLTIPTEEQFRLHVWTNPPLFGSRLLEAWRRCITDVLFPRFLVKLPPVYDCSKAILDLPNALLKWLESGTPMSYIDYLVAALNVGVQCSGEMSGPIILIHLVETPLDFLLAAYGSARDERCIDAWNKTWERITAPIRTVGSRDPNDKVGSPGAGEGRHLSVREPLRYVIFFENVETATAPAQEVVITDQLDTAKLDLSSLHLGLIAFGDRVVIPPPGPSEFTTDVDLRPDLDLIVRIDAGVDTDSGLLTWRLTSLDPETGEPPEDPLAGFLPPNVTPPEGDGSVLFTVMPKNDLPSGSEIRNRATIVFDANAPIETGEVLNTIDAAGPTSSVGTLAETQESAEFTVSWTGEDDEGGAGIRDYTIYVATDDGDYDVWLANTADTSTTFTGEDGHAYKFYSRATDNVGHVEPAPATADAATLVSEDVPVGSVPVGSVPVGFVPGGACGACGAGAPAAVIMSLCVLGLGQLRPSRKR